MPTVPPTASPCHPVWLAICGVVLLPLVAVADEPPAAVVYAAKCADCHGPHGEGTTDYPNPLVGDRPVVDLARVISETMPDGTPEDCVGQEAAAVAEYIHGAFYSEIAQARHAPARVELSRLTVRQHENALADLLGGFGKPANSGDERGLRGQYAKGSRMVDRRGVFERVDPAIVFDWGTDGPDKGKLGSEVIAVQWDGAVIAPATGDYEFAVESTCGVRLWVNTSDREPPLIDGAVRSGEEPLRETIRLIGGRAYPLTLDLQKSKRDKTVAVRLMWTPPGGVEAPIPTRFLTPAEVPSVFVSHAPFPPDDRSTGYIRGNAVSKAWDEAATDAAIETAEVVLSRLDQFSESKSSDGDRDHKLRVFCRRFVERAFRRPLDEREQEFFIDRQFAAAADSQTAVARVVLLALKSPRFLYREAADAGHRATVDHEIAARLAFTLWDSLPDAALTDAANEGRLRTPEQVRAQAVRMAADPRAVVTLRGFLNQWLQLDRLHDLSKDPDRFPGFDEQLAADLRTSLDLFVDEVLRGGGSDFRRLLTDDGMYFNGRLAAFYGADLPADAEFQKVAFESDRRAGVVTHPYLMAGFGYHAESSPIHRGVFLARSVLGRRLKPPPIAVSPAAPELQPGLTTRQRVALQTAPSNCNTCHAMINPLGFALEHFDAAGRFRATDREQPVDDTGSYVTRDGGTAAFAGGRELAAFLAGSREVHEAFAEQLFQYAVKQPVRAYGADRLARLTTEFQKDYDIRRLLVEVAVAAALPDS